MSIRKLITLCCTLFVGTASLCAQTFGSQVTWDRHSLMADGRRIVPVMGEVHYSRLPADEWEDAIVKMKEGGVTIIATYVFWNHIEEEEDVFDWSGQRNLRHFLELCKQHQMPVVLRIGPFCHGEARNGGIPDWVFTKGCKTRSEEPAFLRLAEHLYRQIFTQIAGLQWKDGGPLLACQFDNEYRGRGSYLMALKKIATDIGFDLPFYTRTGWPELSTPVPFGEMLPLYGDYADGFWDRSIQEGVGDYKQAFQFKQYRSSTAIATEQIDYSSGAPSSANDTDSYPYFTCELGGGMMTSYHRRVYLYPEDAYSMALVKLGSGSNLLGYYMYHGGTNPDGKLTYLNENQKTVATNYNDLPVKTYDFQAPLGEFGQPNPHYYGLRPLHLFMQDFGELLAPMEARFPDASENGLRWSYRTADGQSAFIFINNYERFQQLPTRKDVRLEVCNVQLPRIDIPAGCMAVFPVNVEGIRYATAQLLAKRDGTVYLMAIDGIPVTIAMQDGKTLKNVKPRGTATAIYKNICLLTRQQAECFGLSAPAANSSTSVASTSVDFQKIQEPGPLRTITIGVQKVAEEPVDSDFDQAAAYRIDLPAEPSGLLHIDYRGDVARLYSVNGRGERKLVADNFYNGRTFLYALRRLPADASQLELRILPLQADMPVYFPREADTTPGEAVHRIYLQH